MHLSPAASTLIHHMLGTCRPPFPAHDLLPKEMWDKIINLVPRGRHLSHFKSIALTTRVFVPAAQRILFRSIAIGECEYEDMRSCALKPLSSDQLVELVEILGHSTHLISYIHELKIWKCDDEALAPVAKYEIPPHLITLLVLSSLRELDLGFWAPSNFAEIIECCNPAVSSLMLTGMRIRHQLPPLHGANLPPRRPLMITHLGLSIMNLSNAVLLPEIFHPESQIDVSCLTHLALGLSTLEIPFEIWNYMWEAGDDEFICDLLKLDGFPCLTHISIRGVSTALCTEIIGALGPTIQTITYLDFYPTRIVSRLRALESSLLAATLPALHTVRIRCRLRDMTDAREGKVDWGSILVREELGDVPPETEAGVAQWRSIVKDRMPRLVERGMLVLDFGYVDPEWAWLRSENRR
ncbi:hypothetical protein FB45DRAFT_1043703 [Roridomyces roridus]|uniref:Uncharacterized protein n=1 Tax=Roridomyces roridus TaxID=1738132 RepID=A0AAD7AYJ0_9AGAR|nr:hypothetical protein FB45DRAFT_1043703 [Roridomyces roridus]